MKILVVNKENIITVHTNMCFTENMHKLTHFADIYITYIFHCLFLGRPKELKIISTEAQKLNTGNIVLIIDFFYFWIGLSDALVENRERHIYNGHIYTAC